MTKDVIVSISGLQMPAEGEAEYNQDAGKLY